MGVVCIVQPNGSFLVECGSMVDDRGHGGSGGDIIEGWTGVV